MTTTKVRHTVACVECGKFSALDVTPDQYQAWITRSDLIQNIFPNVSPALRELHFLSRICGDCWNNIFSEDEE